MLFIALNNAHVNWADLNVQEYWNCLNTVIINCVDAYVPLVNVKTMSKSKPSKVPCVIRNKQNIRRRLINLDRMRSSIIPWTNFLRKSTVNAP